MKLTLLCSCVLLFGGIVHAETVAFSFSSASPLTSLSGGPSTYGFQFTPVVNITIDSLGYLDVGQDGLATGEQVGIWNSGGTLLTSTVVTTGNSTLEGAVLDGAQFRFTAITPLALLAGQTYTLGASYNETSGDAVYYDFGATQGSNVPSLLTVGPDGFFNVDSGFVDPTNDIGNHYDIGNFTVETAATPEPASMALLLLGLAGIAGTRFRKR